MGIIKHISYSIINQKWNGNSYEKSHFVQSISADITEKTVEVILPFLIHQTKQVLKLQISSLI